MQHGSVSLKIVFSFIACLVLWGELPHNAHAKLVYARKSTANTSGKAACLVVDASTGRVLHEENAGKFRYPASLTKMMTLYLTFEALENKQLSLYQKIPISFYAASQPRMNMGFIAGERISVKDAILSVTIRSANDSAVALAEAVAGNEGTFARKMTERARQLGMEHTIFRNASGLPDPGQKTTAYDLARLAIALRRDFPAYYSFFSQTSFVYKNKVWEGHNPVTRNYPGADGLKTGFVNASGFNLVTSAKRGNTKLIGVVLGGTTAKARDHKMVSLLDRYFTLASGGRVANVSHTVREEVTSGASNHRKKRKAHNRKHAKDKKYRQEAISMKSMRMSKS